MTTDHGAEKLPVYNGGTFSANPLSMAAGMAVMRYLSETREASYARLERAGETVRTALNDFCRANGLPAQMIGIGSMFRTIFTDKPIRSRRQRDLMEIPYQAQRDFYQRLLSAGVHVGANGINFISLAHTDEDLDEVCACYRDALSSLAAK
jgi:glutamate-1-semialdehyde 2,1-aminomutase